VAVACPEGEGEAACLAALAGEYRGTLEEGGSWSVVVDASGFASGTLIDASGAGHALTGLLDANGRLLLSSDAGYFDGQVRVDGSVWGIWTDGEWLRGFFGERVDGPIVIGSVPDATGGTSGGGACYLECRVPAEVPSAAPVRLCTTGGDRADCVERGISLCAASGLGSYEQLEGCTCGNTGEPGCEAPAWFDPVIAVEPTAPCFFHCSGEVRSRCTSNVLTSACAAVAETGCAGSDATVERAASVPDCTCTLSGDTPDCVPEWFRRTACHFQCVGQNGQSCSVDVDEGGCLAAAERACGEVTQIAARVLLPGCTCSDPAPACAWPPWP
jgi:hypothetical protein